MFLKLLINSTLVLFVVFQMGCMSDTKETTHRPNILWLTCEDISPTLAMYGDSTASTPHLDRLAAESLIYKQAFTTVGVCAPSRSSIITGMFPVSIGTHQMRTGLDIFGWNYRIYDRPTNAIDINGDPIPLYSVVTPPDVKCFTEYLRAEGYYCTNNAKTDYQFAAPVTAWDQNGQKAHYNNRKPGQPFFSVFNHNVTHESRMWVNKDKPLTVDPSTVPLPPYFPDTDTVRRDVARNYSNIELLDAQIGEKIDELEKAGLLDSTIIFFYSDHGGPLPRGKRAHYESGLHVPLMVRIPDQLKTTYVDDFVSFVDLGPTVMSLAGIPKPVHMQGKAFLGPYKSKDQREYIFGSGDRFDEWSDRIRSVISKDFVYVKNYHPDLPAYKDVAYRKNIPMTNEMLALNASGDLNAEQSYWFRTTKTEEEFYVRSADPYSLHNVIDDPKYASEIKKHRQALMEWQSDINDIGHVAEKDHLETMWPGGVQPQTDMPEVVHSNNVVSISCATEGSSIAYIVSDSLFTPDLDAGWMVYTKPILVESGQYLYTMGTRIGYKDSEIVEKDL